MESPSLPFSASLSTQYSFSYGDYVILFFIRPFLALSFAVFLLFLGIAPFKIILFSRNMLCIYKVFKFGIYLEIVDLRCWNSQWNGFFFWLTILVLSAGWFSAWKLVLVHVPLVQEIFGMRKKPVMPKPENRRRLTEFYKSIDTKNSASWW